MSLGTRISCGRVRRALQEHYDAMPPRPLEGRESEPLFKPPRFVMEHLSSCRKCSAFARSLEGMGVGLREALDSRLARLPPPRVDETLLLEFARREAMSRGTERHRAAFRRAERRHLWPSRLRWVALPVAAALVAAVLAPILARQAQTRDLVRQEIAAFVDELYAEPLLAGVESGLYGDPDDLELLNQAGGEIERWLDEQDLPGAAFD
jgi:hypothetical protein